MTRIVRGTVIMVATLIPSGVRAQFQPAATPSAIYPADTPWRDFPVGRLRAGAHLRLTSADGQRTEARVIAVGDSVLRIAPVSGDSSRTVTLAELRSLPSVEVQAIRLRSDQSRATTIAFLAGTAAGTIVGVARHRHDDPAVSQVPSKGVDIVRTAFLGGVIAWLFGLEHYSAPRWRPVTTAR